MTTVQDLEQLLGVPDSFDRLRRRAGDLLAGGSAPAAVFDLFEQVRRRMREAGREADEDVVTDVMDCLDGWCSPHVRLIPPTPNDDADSG